MALVSASDPQTPLISLGKRPSPAKVELPTAEFPADGPKVYVETYGCQMNVADSNMLGGLLANAGYGKADEASAADVILINTCAVREKAEERVYRRAQELAAQKRRRKGVVLAVIGCMAEHLKADILERAPEVDIIAGPDSYRRVVDLIERARSNQGEPLVDIKLDKQETYEGITTDGGDGISTFLTIQRGCDKFCTFCVVPYTRGRERGVAPREILRQARRYAEQGYKELTLLGQTVNSYEYEGAGFSELLRAVTKVEGIERIRFTSPYPVSFTQDVIETITAEDKICKFLHLPVQSGSTSVLERMRRGYTVEDFRQLVARIRAQVPEMALSTDILTGFCGETEADHQQTLDLMEEIRFDSAFMFAYSERELTVAARKIPNDVPEEVKKRRLSEIIELQTKISKEKYAAVIGKKQRVLIHSVSKRSQEQLVGRTDDFKSVIVPKGDLKIGDFVDLQISRATMATLFAD